jgi:hypothetical protein
VRLRGFAPLLWRNGVNGNMAVSSTVAVGSSPASAPIKEVFMNESKVLFFLAGLLVGLALFDFVMLFFYILV